MTNQQNYLKNVIQKHHVYKNTNILTEGTYTGLVYEILKNGKRVLEANDLKGIVL